MQRMLALLPFVGLTLVATAAESPPQDESEALFNAPSAASVNEGELVFLDRLPAKPVHHHQNQVRIDATSLLDGWVRLSQCHVDLDAVPRSQVMFSRDRTRDLRVTASGGIGAAWVEGNTVQLQDTHRGAYLCIEARSRALTPHADGSFVLRNGPYLRRFLDGYYPMHVSLRVSLDTPLELVETRPAAQPGFDVKANADEVFIDARFEGRLVTELRFRRTD
jgi:hypothetical protein